MINLVGDTVILKEIEPAFFKYVIEWRNNKDLKKYINQPFQLTLELEKKWYNDYLHDDSQGFLIMIDKKRKIPFGTIGWTDLDLVKKQCISGRLMVGDSRYNGKKELIEAMLLSSDYLYDNKLIKTMYCHIAKENIDSIKFNERFGYVINKNIIEYPHELLVNGFEQIEFYRKKEQYEISKKHIKMLFDFK